ncbi:MAG: hypothetical protein FJX56_12770, partial [Alphaproteobacteria bacterium]|nr:hypothetical protein [Alphaproteobacteria bacterium]
MPSAGWSSSPCWPTYGRIHRIGDPLLFSNADLCAELGVATASLGFELNNVHSFDFVSGLGEAARSLGFGDKLSVAYLSEGGVAGPTGRKASDLVYEHLSEMLGAGRQAAVVLRRGREELHLTATPRLTCDCYFGLSPAAEIQASANGEGVVVNSGLMRFVDDDMELATVLDHELAYNLNDHLGAKRANAAAGLVFDVLAALAGVNTQGAFGRAAAIAYGPSS